MISDFVEERGGYLALSEEEYEAGKQWYFYGPNEIAVVVSEVQYPPSRVTTMSGSLISCVDILQWLHL